MKLTFTYDNKTYTHCDVQELINKVPDDILLSEVKKAKIQEVKQKASEVINSSYPLWKQSNDKDDKERIIVELVFYFKNIITVDDIRYSIAKIVAKNSDIFTELVNYGVKAGFIQTDDSGKPLFSYTLSDETTQIANIDREYIDDSGTVQVIPEENIVDRQLLYTEGTDNTLIDKAVTLANQLLEITGRILWKDGIREKSNQIEQEINSLTTIDEVLNYEIKF